jgi:hypothetical protein
MVVVWSILTVGALFGAIAGAMFEGTPLIAVSFGLMAVASAIGAYQSIAGK